MWCVCRAIKIITTILKRKYVDKQENKLHATELGETVNKILVNNFPNIFDVKFTATMEDELDKIASNEYNYEDVLNDFYKPFTESLDRVNSQREHLSGGALKFQLISSQNTREPTLYSWEV